jgi:hypothetical protein
MIGRGSFGLDFTFRFAPLRGLNIDARDIDQASERFGILRAQEKLKNAAPYGNGEHA